MHWCPDESAAVLATLPFIGVYWTRLRAFLHRVFCKHTHEEHNHDQDLD